MLPYNGPHGLVCPVAVMIWEYHVVEGPCFFFCAVHWKVHSAAQNNCSLKRPSVSEKVG